MKDYEISRSTSRQVGCVVRCYTSAGESSYVLPHCEIHSPCGFECGYGGSGPSDLAVSILADWFGETPRRVRRVYRKSLGYNAKNRALVFHQDFKWQFIAPLKLEPGQSQMIHDADIRKWFERYPTLTRRARFKAWGKQGEGAFKVKPDLPNPPAK